MCNSSNWEKINKKVFLNDDIIKNEIIINNTITISDENYLDMLEQIKINLDEYKDKRIIVTGFVFKDSQFNKSEFVIARMMLACCAADTEVIGFLCKSNNAAELEGDQWIKVEGVIDSTQYNNSYMQSSETIPVIIVDRIDKIEVPENVYIYPK